jgi:DMATS type aromatic prenyltransferase
MGGRAVSLYTHVGDQVRVLCEILGLQPHTPLAIVRELLDPIGGRPVTEPPAWPSDVSDDHTPVEYSVACDHGAGPTLRVLAEAIAARPGPTANLEAADTLLNSLASRLNLSLDQFDRVRGLFLDTELLGLFSMWFSLVHRPGDVNDVKIYFDPNATGVRRAPHLVAEGLRRLDLDGAYETVVAHGTRPGQLGKLDRLSFFAVDLHAGTHARVKVYLSHHQAQAADMMRAARAVDGLSDAPVREFLELTGYTGTLRGRPLVSSYSFVDGDTDRPSGYSLYVPIRDHVGDDDEARDRVLAVLDRYGFDPSVVDRAIHGVARRPLADGVGLIAHVSLRLAANRPPGVTVYLSSEAYHTMPARTHAAAALTPAARSGDEDLDRRVPVQTGSETCR